APARTGMVAALRSRVFRLSTPDEAREGSEGLESQESAAPEREEATVPVAPVTALDETPVEASVGAGRPGGSHRREAATRRLARSTIAAPETAARETAAREKEPAGEHD
ncbi:MAG TPA: hypothetical protein VHA75_01825, partial [Rugosimonospora sp.]|nr:hypothetical protein [Rugosimonospora sp.]